jgi:hypothetical protein
LTDINSGAGNAVPAVRELILIKVSKARADSLSLMPDKR